MNVRKIVKYVLYSMAFAVLIGLAFTLLISFVSELIGFDARPFCHIADILSFPLAFWAGYGLWPPVAKDSTSIVGGKPSRTSLLLIAMVSFMFTILFIIWLITQRQDFRSVIE